MSQRRDRFPNDSAVATNPLAPLGRLLPGPVIDQIARSAEPLCPTRAFDVQKAPHGAREAVNGLARENRVVQGRMIVSRGSWLLGLVPRCRSDDDLEFFQGTEQDACRENTILD